MSLEIKSIKNIDLCSLLADEHIYRFQYHHIYRTKILKMYLKCTNYYDGYERRRL